MRQSLYNKLITWVWGVFLLTGVAIAQAQSAPPVERLFITDTSVSSLPSIELIVYGRNAQGVPLDLAQETLAILHNGEPVGPIEVQGIHTAGTFTLFLIDIPTGVAGQLPALQDAINQFAGPGNMVEQIDSVAVYQVGETAATELLAPTNFYNSVRNLFAQPLTAELGPTALYDSTVGLLEQIDALKPNPQMALAIVLITDGTDAVSTRFQADDVTERAAEAGIPIHTIWLDNENIPTPSFGQDYLAEVAAGTGGISVRLQNTADLPLIWNRIGGFRDQTRVRYMVGGLASGSFPVEISLATNADIKAETTVDIPNNIPSVVINLAPENRTLSLPSVEEPVPLQFATSVSWLDGVEREITAAQLVINGDQTTPYDIPVDDITEFRADIINLAYGNNSVEVVVIDNQGIRATSPVIVLTVNEGARDIPDELDAGGGFGQLLLRILLVLVVIALVIGATIVLWRTGFLTRFDSLMPRGPKRRRRSVTVTSETPAYVPTHTVAYLEVLESVSHLSSPIALSAAVIKIGRSPVQCDIAFQDDITVSRSHANLMLEGNHYRIFDENSTSGTWVNERQVPEYGTQLMDGDEIHLGAVHLRFRQA